MQTGTSRVTTDSNQRPADSAAPKPKLLDQVRQAIRALHYSKRTEKTYVDWIKRFVFFHGKRHPLEMGEPEINQFLTDLAVSKKVSASTQNQALSAILFLYQRVLDKPLEWVNPAVRAKKPKRLPVVFNSRRSADNPRLNGRRAQAGGDSALRCRASSQRVFGAPIQGH